jgi:hypothetical protein
MSNTSGLTDKEEVELLYALKQLPDFDCLPLPVSWFEKYKLAPRAVVGPREYIESNHAMKMALAEKDLPILIINKPQQDGKLVEVQPPEVVDIKVVSRPFVIPAEGFPNVICPEHMSPTLLASLPEVAPTADTPVPQSPRKYLDSLVSPIPQ